jgi:nucleoside 2-deoxyribosyltransferase
MSAVTIWRQLRLDPNWSFIHWTASWPDDVDKELTASEEDFSGFWRKDISEILDSDFVLLLGDQGLKGALVECGAAMAERIRVIAVALGREHTWSYHPMVTRVADLEEARTYLYRYTTAVPPRRKE